MQSKWPSTISFEMPTSSAEAPLSVSELWDVIHGRTFRGRALGVIALALCDTVLTSIGVGAVFSPFFRRFSTPTIRAGPSAACFRLSIPCHPIRGSSSWQSGRSWCSPSRLPLPGWPSCTRTPCFRPCGSIGSSRFGTYLLCGPFRELAYRKQGELFNDWFNETLSGTRFFQSFMAYVSSLVLVSALVLLGFVCRVAPVARPDERQSAWPAASSFAGRCTPSSSLSTSCSSTRAFRRR